MAAEQPSTEADWDAVSFIVASNYRVAVYQNLADGPAIPSKIAEETGVTIAHVSRALNTLRDKGLVELLVPEDRRKGRVYGMTDQGSQIVEKVDEVA